MRPLVRAGGKGVNVARVGHQFGHPVVAVAPVGGGDGARFRADLESSGVPHRLVPVLAGPAQRGHRRERGQPDDDPQRGRLPVGAEGWRALEATITSLLDARDGFGPVAVLVGSGSLPEDAPPDFYARLVHDARARGIPSVIDTSGEQLLAAARAGADLLKPNQQELAETVGEATPWPAAAGCLTSAPGGSW